MFSNVIVGVDGHSGARDAVALARDLIATGGELALANVRRADRTRERNTSGALTADDHQRARWLLEAARRDAGIEAALLVAGSPSVGQGLHGLAELHGADLIVVGCNGLGRIGRAMLGDDTRDALSGARCAVAVAPPGYAERERPALLDEIGVGYDGSPESRRALAVARKLAAERGAKLSTFEAVSNPVEELVLYGASVDLLVVGSRGYRALGRLVRGSTSQLLARTARCPLLVVTPSAATLALASGEAHAHQPEHSVAG